MVSIVQTERIQYKTIAFCLYVCFFTLVATSVFPQEQQIRIGTFNIEWLGDGYKDQIIRNEVDYQAIAKIIENINCDVLALQEIENEVALKKVLDKLKRKYNFIIDPTSDNNLKVAIIFDQSFQKIDEQLIHFSRKEITFKRPALYLKLKKKNKEFEFISVHLKSSFNHKKDKRKKDTEITISPKEIRYIQANELIEWMKKNQKNHSILMGDFNEEYESGTILKMFEHTFQSMVISKNMISCANSKWKMIDHIILPEHFRNAFKPERLQNFNHRVLYTPKNAPSISDHCLLYYTLTY